MSIRRTTSFLKFLGIALLMVALGLGLVALGFQFPEMRSALWPFDGLLAACGGVGLLIWGLTRLPRS